MDLLKKYFTLLVAVVALVVALMGGGKVVVDKVTENLAGISNVDVLSVNQLQVNGVSTLWKEVDIEAGTSTEYWKNLTRGQVIVDYLAFETTGTASSSYR